ncbi:glycosyltransferase [Pseudonocardia sp.]|uniref:glycosyltransferase n=1 Tax=Pseudonocardia sp. TaxID=60912 RepID=UPI003D0A4D02
MSRHAALRGHLLRPKRLLLATLFVTFCCILLVNGLIRSQVGVDALGAAAEGPDDHVPSAVTDGGPIVDLTDGHMRSFAMPPRTVALTFDDGPDPTWTPQIFDVLRSHGVPGTFFVVGSHVTAYPELVREIRDSGSEIGLHTFTHPDLGTVSPQRVSRELAATQLALAGATGRLSYLVRPPYSSEASAVDDAGYAVMQQIGADGYVTAFVDVDGEDWQRPGVDQIVADATPPDGQGAVVLLHDAGGDRAQTVAALEKLIPELQAKGYTFTTVTAGAGLPDAATPASWSQRALGTLLLGAAGTAELVVGFLEWSLLIVGGLVVLRLVVMVVAAVVQARRRRRQSWGLPVTVPVSVVVPAYNEKDTIERTVRSLVASDHPLEVIVVDDGSTDATAELVASLRLRNVRVLRQPNGGKPAALNAGIAAARNEIVVMMDGDTIFEPSTVRRLVQPFADPAVGAVAGNARVADRRRLISRWQHIEYVIGFNIDRRVQDLWQAMTTVPGAIGAYRRYALREVGGVSDDTLAEDTDLTIALGRRGWAVVYEPTARAWTDAPSTFAQLWRQRYRWSYGVMQSLWKHRHALVERGRSGHVGRVGLLVTALFQVVLPLLAPMVDVYLVYGMIFLDPATTLVTWSAVLGLQMLTGAVAFRLEGEPLRGLLLLPLQQVVYRQLMYAVLAQSVLSALVGDRLRWQKIPRAGRFSAAELDGALR